MSSGTRPVAAIVAVTIAATGLMVLSGMGPNLLLVTSLAGLIGVAVWTVSALADATPATAPIDATTRPTPSARGEQRVTRLRTGLAYADANGLVFEQLHERLVAVIDDQLRVAHQIDRAVEPRTARAVLGADLQAFVDDPATAAADLARPRRLDHILNLIEQL